MFPFKHLFDNKLMRFSVIAFLLSFLVSILSKGILGEILFLIATKPLALFFPTTPSDVDNWKGEWVNSAMIVIAILWSFAFLIAAFVCLRLEKLNWTKLTLKTSYMVILLVWNFLLWCLLLLNMSV